MTADGVEPVTGTGLPVGLFCGGEYGSVTRQLGRGDVLLLYTDGVSEARSADGAEFGAERVTAALASARGESAEKVVDAVLRELAHFRQGAPLSDDVTVMAVRRVA
jgi:sigma-B regulation protein RsbU (phosphoserine phosphatase)